MSRTSKSDRAGSALRSEYRFDYAKGRLNRFASKFEQNTVAVILDPDVAKVFKTSHEVNRLLRSVISAVPQGRRKSGRKAS